MTAHAVGAAVATAARRRDPRRCALRTSTAAASLGAASPRTPRDRAGRSARRAGRRIRSRRVADWCDDVARSLRTGSSLAAAGRRRGGDGFGDGRRSSPRSCAAVGRGRSLVAALDARPRRPGTARRAGAHGAALVRRASAARRPRRSNGPRPRCATRDAVAAEQLAQSAQARLSARVMTLVPIGMLALLAPPTPSARSDRHPGRGRRRDARCRAQRRRCAVDATDHRAAAMTASAVAPGCRCGDVASSRPRRACAAGRAAPDPATATAPPTVARRRRRRRSVVAVAAIARRRRRCPRAGLAIVAAPSSAIVRLRRRRSDRTPAAGDRRGDARRHRTAGDVPARRHDPDPGGRRAGRDCTGAGAPGFAAVEQRLHRGAGLADALGDLTAPCGRAPCRS